MIIYFIFLCVLYAYLELMQKKDCYIYVLKYYSEWILLKMEESENNMEPPNQCLLYYSRFFSVMVNNSYSRFAWGWVLTVLVIIYHKNLPMDMSQALLHIKL